MFLNRNRNADKNKGDKGPVKDIKEISAIKIQCMIRKFLARQKVRRQAQIVWVRVFDPAFKRYFWYQRLAGKSSWDKPRFIQEVFDNRDREAAENINRIIRGFIARCRVKRIAAERYGRYYDVETKRFYWHDRKSDTTTYNASPWLKSQNIPMAKEDNLLFEAEQRIKELERQLQEKDKEIKAARKARYDDLQPQIIKDKVKAAKNLQRSKHMDDWSTDDLAAWFTELKMEEYIPNLYNDR
jgi:hypothetical protein